MSVYLIFVFIDRFDHTINAAVEISELGEVISVLSLSPNEKPPDDP